MSNPEQKDHAIEMGEALAALRNDPNFQKVIVEGYFCRKALDSTSLLGVPQRRQDRNLILEDLVSISNFQFYLNMIDQDYIGAVDPILSDEEKAELEASE